MIGVGKNRNRRNTHLDKLHSVPDAGKGMTKAQFGTSNRHQLLGKPEVEASFHQPLQSDFRDSRMTAQLYPLVLRLLADKTDTVGSFSLLADEEGERWNHSFGK